MTSRTIEIAPIRKTLTVQASQAYAFEVFTKGVDRWWPKTHGIGPGLVERSVIEPREGGLWYSVHEGNVQVVIGHVQVWDPPSRVVFSWEVSAAWKPDASTASEVEVRFISEGPKTTRVELLHHKFAALGIEGGQKMRGDLNSGWPGLLELFKRTVEV